jgi:D-alanyl-D-alanine carboxypeptidase/D-alanyl-D-alanine-endopeptidase (penicillin-binding protein 4)
MKALKSVLFFLLITKSFAISIDIDSLENADPLSKNTNSIKELQNDLIALVESSDFANSMIGVSVLSLRTGEFFFRHNSNKNFIPASTLKLITTAAALDYLGSDYRYTTRLYLDGDLADNGLFTGNIIIRGAGDPSFSRFYREKPLEIIEQFVNCLDSLGISSIQGNIIGDDSYFDDVYYAPGWAWDDMLYPYSAQVNAISINDNKLDFFVFQGDTVGETTKISVYPENSYIRIINNVKTGSSEELTNISLVRDYGTNLIELKGVIAYDSTDNNYDKISATIDNPTLFFLNIFREELENKFIRFRGALLDIDDIDVKHDYTALETICEFKSPTLSEMIKVINQSSHNLSAELLLKTISKENTGSGNFMNGIEEINNYLNENGINHSSVSINDGSGLSRLNLISPDYMVTLLSSVYRSEFKDIFRASLARPGEFGTLERRMRRSLAAENVIAKTGSMNNVSNISGYVTTSDGEELAYSIMMQGFTVPGSLAHNLQDLMLMRLSSFSRK